MIVAAGTRAAIRSPIHRSVRWRISKRCSRLRGARHCFGAYPLVRCLAVSAASQLAGIEKLATYEAPLIVDGSRKSTELDWEKIRKAIAADRRGDAVRAFLVSVGLPRPVMFIMQFMPVWKTLKAVAHTLAYDFAIVGEAQRGQPLGHGAWENIAVPTLVTDGGASPAWMRHGNRALADVIPGARYETLAKQTHMLDAKAYALTLIKFFNA
jgi:pimeloyl-ACP methyl ester carboxylesterase